MTIPDSAAVSALRRIPIFTAADPTGNWPHPDTPRPPPHFAAPGGPAGSLVAAVILRPYLQRLIGRRNRFLAHSLAG